MTMKRYIDTKPFIRSPGHRKGVPSAVPLIKNEVGEQGEMSRFKIRTLSWLFKSHVHVNNREKWEEFFHPLPSYPREKKFWIVTRIFDFLTKRRRTANGLLSTVF
ncbi:hypothetical protein CEXT_225001 [Caerostris extrusa]|uniref:Uncharacterized protein n=1 Tax=Caerostris extrusa TaxID=172846 RepID=A0AAV4XSN1_CAEEX|nr:hypothetical protein CEXT_225001 [Caerostris extrusa]